MAIYYSRVSVISRAQGHSAVAAAAYRAGACLRDDRTGLRHDYSRKRGVLAVSMLAPRNATWAKNPSIVWNRAERVEVRRNARTAREVILALPAELSVEQNIALAERMGQDLVERYGVAVQVAVHAPDARGDQRNVHVHLLLTTRSATADGFGPKTRVLDDRRTGPLETELLRAHFAERINTALRQSGRAEDVDPRRLDVQAREAAACGNFDAVVALTRTPQRHQGRAATALARAGKQVDRVAANAAVKADNVEVARWGRARASALKGVVQRRAALWVKQAQSPPRSRAALPHLERHRRAKGHGIGAMGSVTRATGNDAELLNSQAEAALASARAARDATETYLDLIGRNAELLEQAFRAYLGRLAAAPTDVRVHAGPAIAAEPRRTARYLVRASEARDAWERCRAAAHPLSAEHAHRPALSPREATRPRSPVLSRREWAERRRRQRTAEQTPERVARERWEWAHARLLRHVRNGQREVATVVIEGALRREWDALDEQLAQVEQYVHNTAPHHRPRRRPGPR